MPSHQYFFSIWLRAFLSVFCLIFVVVYWQERGPQNFLWFSDIAFFLVVLVSWVASSYLLSMAAVSALFLELAWNLDFFFRLLFGSHLFGMDATAYMFDATFPANIKTLSLVLHLLLPLMIVYMLIKLGYHRQAWKAQVGLLCLLLPFCYLATDPERNINWVFGIGGVQTIMPGWLYVIVQILVIFFFIYLPTHLILKKLVHESTA